MQAGLAVTPGPVVVAIIAGPAGKLAGRLGFRPVLLVGAVVLRHRPRQRTSRGSPHARLPGGLAARARCSSGSASGSRSPSSAPGRCRRCRRPASPSAARSTRPPARSAAPSASPCSWRSSDRSAGSPIRSTGSTELWAFAAAHRARLRRHRIVHPPPAAPAGDRRRPLAGDLLVVEAEPSARRRGPDVPEPTSGHQCPRSGRRIRRRPGSSPATPVAGLHVCPQVVEGRAADVEAHAEHVVEGGQPRGARRERLARHACRRAS